MGCEVLNNEVIRLTELVKHGQQALKALQENGHEQGWHYIDNMNGWQYFRIESDKAKDAEIYTDADSLNGKYRRLLAVLSLASIPLLISVLNGGLSRPGFGGSFLFYLYGTMLLLILYAWSEWSCWFSKNARAD